MCRASEPAKEPYRWYPRLDLARVPFHAGAGPWGPQAQVAAPAAPVTTRVVRVTSAAQFAAEARMPGTQIVVGAQFIGPVTVLADVRDLDIVVPRGHRVAQLTLGRYAPPSSTERVRIRGTSPGSHSGGVVGAITFASTGTVSDVIIDGVDLNGDNAAGGHMLWHFVRAPERVAIVNNRGHGVGSGSLDQQGAVDLVIAGNRFATGAREREVNGYPEGWGVRSGGRVIVFENRMDGTRYHRLRLHPQAGVAGLYAWIAHNTFVDPHEARILWIAMLPGGNARYAGVWAQCNQVYAHSVCLPPSFEAQSADFAQLTHNAFHGSFTEKHQRTLQAQHGAGRDYVTGNTFAPWRSPPAWEAPGDPTQAIGLPAVDPGRFNAALRSQQPCPPP